MIQFKEILDLIINFRFKIWKHLIKDVINLIIKLKKNKNFK